MSYIDLNSVGSSVSSEGSVFPINCNESPETSSEAEEMMGVHLYDIDSEWFNSLSSDDLTDFFEFVELNSDVVKSVYNDWKTKLWGEWEEANNCYMNLEVI